MYVIVLQDDNMYGINETNSSALETILIGLGIAHLVLVWIPAVVLGTSILVFISKLLKANQKVQINSTILLYSIMVIISISGPSTYGLLSDISLIIGIPKICKYYPSGIAVTLSFVIFHTLLSNITGLVAVLQFLILKYGKRLTIKTTFIGLIIVIILSVTIPCAIVFNEYDYIEIRGTQCVSDPATTQLHLAILLVLGYLPPLVITIASTLTTHFKLKRCVVDQKKSLIVRSVLAINSFNIVQFNVFRAASIMTFYIGISMAPKDDISMFKLFTLIGRYIADLSYPVTICSILIVHKSIRSLLSDCLQNIFCIKSTPKKFAMDISSQHLTVTSLSLGEKQLKNEE